MKFLLFFFIVFISNISSAIAAVPDINCWGLPCPSTEGNLYNVIGNVIATGIKYVAVIAVIAVMIGGIMYILSSGQEEKTKQAKNIIIWALVGTFLSVSAMWLISIVNNFRLF